MPDYGSHFSTLKTPQRERARPEQVKNNAGGYVFEVDCWKRLDRFLILGAEGGTYYVGERELTRDNAQAVLECLAADGPRTVARIVEISVEGRAPKNDPAIFALAMAAGADDVTTRRAALSALPKVCRIGTHLFHFARDVEKFRRWGKGLRRAVAAWYTSKSPEKLAHQLLKYQQRDGWGHRDLIRLAHPSAPTPRHDAAFRWATSGADQMGERSVRRGKAKDARVASYGPHVLAELPMLAAYEELKRCESAARVIELIGQHGFTHEMIPSQFKNNPDVWDALLVGMPVGAMVRNLGKMSQVCLLKPMGAASKFIADSLGDVEKIRDARLHPIALLSALRVYQQGHGEKGKLTWPVVREVVDALDGAFYLAFQAIAPTGARTMLCLDVSGSMDGGTIAGCPGITPRVASAAMAMVTARTEQCWAVMGFGHQFVELDISPKQRLDDVVRKISGLPFGRTDCSLPMQHCAGNDIDVDAFVIYTDNETWCGSIHPFQALRAYRAKTGIGAKLVVVAATATQFTIADPRDAGMLDVAGFDTAAPALIADFVRPEGGAAA